MLRRISALACAVFFVVAVSPASAGFGSQVTLDSDTPSGDPAMPPPQLQFDESGGWVVATDSQGPSVNVQPSTGTGFFAGGWSNSSLAVARNGAAIVAMRAPGSNGVSYSYRSPGGNFTTPFGSFGGTNVGEVAAGIDSFGNAVIVWKDDAGIRYALSQGATFGTPATAPLGSPGFQGRINDAPRDEGPRAFRDDAGNVVIVYRDAAGGFNNVVVARRDPSGGWRQDIIGGGMYDFKADADAASRRLAIAMSGGNQFKVYEGNTFDAGTGSIVATELGGNNADVDVAPGGFSTAAWSVEPSHALRSASCLDGWQAHDVATASSNISGVGAAMTTDLNVVVTYSNDAAPAGSARWSGAASVGPANFSLSPLTTTENGGVMVVAADYDGNALTAAARSDFRIIGYPFASDGVWTGSNSCPGTTPPAETDPRVIACFYVFTPECEALIGKPDPLQTCVALWQKCDGFGGGKTTKGKIDLSGFPASLKTKVGCQEAPKNPFTKRPGRGSPFGSGPRKDFVCQIRGGIAFKESKLASKEVQSNLNRRQLESEVDAARATIMQLIDSWASFPDRSEVPFTAEERQKMAAGVAAARALAEHVYARLRRGRAADASDLSDGRAHCGLASGEAQGNLGVCVLMVESTWILIDAHTHEFAKRAKELGVASRPAAARAGGAAKRSKMLFLGGGLAQVQQGETGTLKLKFPKEARKLLKRLRAKGAEKVKAQATLEASIAPGVESAKTTPVTILLR